MKISLLSACFHLVCHSFYVYLQLKFQKFSTIGLVALTIWVINDKYVNFWAKGVGIPMAVLLHLYGSVHDLMVLEWVAYVAVILLSFLRKEPPLPSRKFSAKPIALDNSAISAETETLHQQFPTSPLSPTRRMQSVGFVLPSSDEYDNPPSSGDSPRILRSEEKIKRDKNKLQLALDEARAAEEKRIAAAAATLLQKKKSK